jgi:imidazolonepropionase-like amidohydrolase
VTGNFDSPATPEDAMTREAAALLSLVLTCTAAGAAPATVVRASHWFDATTGVLRGPVSVVVRDGKIAAIGSDAAVPAGAEVIDLGDATLLPGFIDAHVHIDDEDTDNPYRHFHDSLLDTPADRALHSARFARRTLQAGFTTVRDVGSEEFVDVALRRAVAAGDVPGPRIVASGYAIGSPGSHCDTSFPSGKADNIAPRGPLQGVCSGADQCRETVRLQMKYGADVIKFCASGGVLSESDPLEAAQFTPAEMAAIVSEAHTWGRKVAAHAHGDHAAKLAVEAGVDSIEHGSFLSIDTLKLMKAKGTVLVPTRLAAVWVDQQADTFPPAIAVKARAVKKTHGEMVANAYRLGVPMAFGTDTGVSPHGLNAREFGLLVDLGIPPTAVLLAATRDAARLLGVDRETGTLEPGKSADIVAVPGNVLADIRSTEHPIFVMARGTRVSN